MAPERYTKAAQWLLGVAVWAWVGALAFAPAAVWPFCSVICHQRPERSFIIDRVQLPVCARCTGLYVGAALAVPLMWFVRSGMVAQRAQRILAVAALPTAITWTLEFAGLAGFSNTSRFLAALPLGFVAAWLVLGVLGDRTSVIGHRTSVSEPE